LAAIQNRGQWLFRQARPGWHGQLFRLYKIQTMTSARDASGQLLPDADRLPPLGRWLRATSLDELPQLWNIVRGDLSLVGPRPLLPEYLPLYSPTQARRHEVRPGLTGWAQVNGRNAISWEEKFAYDVWYVLAGPDHFVAHGGPGAARQRHHHARAGHHHGVPGQSAAFRFLVAFATYDSTFLFRLRN
jgi:lipopolysaccharide/colanic/teichoic acid biosynthesis glycosyltransferase